MVYLGIWIGYVALLKWVLADWIWVLANWLDDLLTYIGCDFITRAILELAFSATNGNGVFVTAIVLTVFTVMQLGAANLNELERDANLRER